MKIIKTVKQLLEVLQLAVATETISTVNIAPELAKVLMLELDKEQQP